MAWKPDGQPPKHILFEVKGGDWGFSDIFKVYGWETYLQPRGVESAYIIAPRHNKTEDTINYMKTKCNDIGIQLITYDDLSSLETNLKNIGLMPPSTSELDHTMWRFSFWLERQMQQVVAISRKAQKSNRGPVGIYKYQELIRNGFLQARDVRERLSSLYETHFNHRLLAKSIAAELDGFTLGIAKTPLLASTGMKHCIIANIPWYRPPCTMNIERGWTSLRGP